MARVPENPLTFRSLHESAVLSVREYSCRACRGGPEAEELSDSSNIVLMRQGAFCKHFGRKTVTADLNHAVFFSKGSTYRVSHPADCGDRGTVFSLPPGVLHDIVQTLDPTAEDRPERPFPFVTGPCESGVFWRHRQLARRLEGDGIDPLGTDVAALGLVADVLGAAFAHREQPRRRRRDSTDADHAERAEAVKSHLAARLGERVTLDDLARAVHASPFHLARVFQQRTGLPIHRYLMLLRLRAALDQLAEDANDLTALALAVGFSSHSHFSDAFRREFAIAPSEARRQLGRKGLREMSKDLEV